MKIVIVGLGKMGHQIAAKLHSSGHDVLGFVRRQEVVDSAANEGIAATIDRDVASGFFGNERAIVWLMIPAGAVDDELDMWLKALPSGSIVIDGGNSKYLHTKQRALRAKERDISFIDIGTSGGIHGFSNGFSLMAGGDIDAFTYVEELINNLSAPRGAYHHFGPSGSGHYVKMVHNAIEYGMMQSLAEGYQMLHEGAYAGEIDLAAAGEVWQHGSVVTSWLNGLIQEALVENPTLDDIDGYVAESGEARWTLENADELGIPLPAIQSAYDVRVRSQQGETSFATKLLAAMRNKFGGHAINKL